MQQGFVFAVDVEVPLLHTQRPVVEKQGGSKGVFGELAQFLFMQKHQAHAEGEEQNREQRGKNTANAAAVKVAKGKPLFVQLAPDDAADEVARDDKEDVHAHKTARKQRPKIMEGQDPYHGNGAQPVDERDVY